MDPSADAENIKRAVVELIIVATQEKAAQGDACEEPAKAGPEPADKSSDPVKYRVLASATVRTGKDSDSKKVGEHSKGDIIDVVQEVVNGDGLTVMQTITAPSGSKRGGWIKLETSKGKVLLKRLKLDNDTEPEPEPESEPPPPPEPLVISKRENARYCKKCKAVFEAFSASTKCPGAHANFMYTKKILDDAPRFEVTEASEPEPRPPEPEPVVATAKEPETQPAEEDEHVPAEAKPDEAPAASGGGVAIVLEKKMVVKGLKVFRTKDPTQTGVIMKKAGTNAYVDFSESGGDPKKLIGYKELSTITTMQDGGGVEAAPEFAADLSIAAKETEAEVSADLPAGTDLEALYKAQVGFSLFFCDFQ